MMMMMMMMMMMVMMISVAILAQAILVQEHSGYFDLESLCQGVDNFHWQQARLNAQGG